NAAHPRGRGAPSWPATADFLHAARRAELDAFARCTTPGYHASRSHGRRSAGAGARLIDEEKTGAQALHGLAQREKGLGGGLDSLLLEMMAMDSEKHARLLLFVQRRLEARAGAGKR